MQLDLSQLSEILAAFDNTEISELVLKSGDFELTLRKEKAEAFRVGVPVDAGLAIAAEGAPAIAPPPTPFQQPSPPAAGMAAAPNPGTSAASPGPATAPGGSDRKWVDIISPMVGTFYRSPAPDEPPFVSVGDRITGTQTVCIIEAMKLMNEIEAEVSGQVMEILVENGSPVEYGQPLMRVNPE